VRPTKGGMPFPTKFHQASGPADLSERMLAGAGLVNEAVLREMNRSGVVTTLRTAMRKLGAQTRAQLVEKLRVFPMTA